MTRSARAYTILELLVVVSIIALVIAAGIPAFSGMLRETNRSMADTKLRIAVQAARETASLRGRDAAAVFMYVPGVGTRIVVCVHAGQMVDNDRSNSSSQLFQRDVFVPDATIEPVVLPGDWNVRGYAAGGVVDQGTTSGITLDYNGWYDQPTVEHSSFARSENGQWVFPETHFMNPEPEEGDALDAGELRHTFMIRFSASTGTVSPVTEHPAVVVDPLPTESFRTGAPFDQERYRADRAEDLTKWVQRVINAPDLDTLDRMNLLGDRSPDTILAREVTQYALYQEQNLAEALLDSGDNVSLDSVTDTVYTVSPNFDERDEMQLVENADPRSINWWFEQRLMLEGSTTARVDAAPRVFMLPRYQSRAIEILGLPVQAAAQGVTP